MLKRKLDINPKYFIVIDVLLGFFILSCNSLKITFDNIKLYYFYILLFIFVMFYI